MQVRPYILASALAAAGAMLLSLPTVALSNPATGVDSGTKRIRVNEFTSNAQDHAAIAVDPVSGLSFVVWGSRRQEQGGYGVFGRMLDASGKPIGGEIHINQYLINNQQDPAVAFGPDGSAWVVWQSFLQDGDQGTIVMRRFGAGADKTFSALSNEIIVNEITAGDQIAPSITISDDRVLVVWQSRERNADDVFVSRIKARVFDITGEPIPGVSGELVLSASDAALPSASPQPGGGFIYVVAERDANGTPRAIIAQRLDRNGSRVGAPIGIATDNERWNVEPVISSDDAGGFVVAWMGASETRGWDVYARRFDAQGVPQTDEIVIARCSPGAWKSGVDITMTRAGGFVVAFNSEADGPVQIKVKNPQTPAQVLYQMVDSRGNRIGDPTSVNEREDGRRILSIASNQKRIAYNPRTGSVMVAWEGTTREDRSGVGVTILATRAITKNGKEDNTMLSGAPRTPGYSIDSTILASNTLADVGVIDRFPPDYDPFFVPEPPDRNILNPGTDFGFQAFQSTGWTPPDPDIAAGPNHVVVMVNGGIRFYDKLGNLTFADDISGAGGFWGSVGANFFVFDPVEVFDQQSQRFIVATTEHADNGNDLINLAVSDDADPNGTWHKYRFDFTSVGDFIDFPNLGVGPDAIYITADYFSGNTGNRIHIFNKNDVMNGFATTPNVVTTSPGFRSLGAVNHLTADAPAQYFATAFDGTSTQIGIDAIRDPNGNPIRDNFLLSVPPISQPPNADQLGTSNRASTVDMRIKNGVYRDGFLYLSHTIGQGGTARVRWYVVAMNGWPASGQNPTLWDVGTQDLGPGVHNWFPDIAVDELGRIGIAFNQSSSSEFISVQRTFRLPTDSAGTLRPPQLMQVSTSPEQGSRWGDYGGIEPDPVTPGVFWTHHEYRTSGWRTWVGGFDIEQGLEPIGFIYPDGLPTIIDSDGGSAFLVNVIEQSGIPQPGTGVLHVNTGAGFEPFPMADLGNNRYNAVFPSTPCGATVEFYVSAETDAGELITDPSTAPASFFTAEGFAEIITVFADDFETNQEWTIENIDLTAGAWQRGIPAGDGLRGDPTADFDGSGQCMLTGNRSGNSDVDGGPTRLISPTFDLSGNNDVIISYARWFFNDDADTDRLDVEISNDDGDTWTLIESVSDDGTGGWIRFRFNPADFISLTDLMKMRFSATDNPNDSVTEAAVDAFEVIIRSCTGGGNTILTAAEVIVGTLRGGDIDSLRASDDIYFRTRSGFGSTFLDLHNMTMIVFASTTVQTPTTIDLSFETRIDHPSGISAISMFNWNTFEFEQIGSFAIGSGGDTVNSINNVSAANRVDASGAIAVQIKHTVFVPFVAFVFHSFIDEVRLNVQ